MCGPPNVEVFDAPLVPEAQTMSSDVSLRREKDGERERER